MKSFDANILIYAHRSDQPEHEFFRDYLEQTIQNEPAFALSTSILSAFLRIVTQPRFPNGPTDLHHALLVIESLVAQEHCHVIGPGHQHVQIFSELCRKHHGVGNLIADAQHATITIEHACDWVTRDRDFERFVADGLRLEIIEPS
ncbi:MAG: TA system VapC family ribonuclease toxin [Opitutales bacterium]